MTEEELYQFVWSNNWPIGHRDEIALRERLADLIRAEKQLHFMQTRLSELGTFLGPWMKP